MKEEKLKFIESISTATNKQNQVNNADRSSNEEELINAQKIFFEKYGMFLERKRGEFYDGIKEEYIEKDQLINRSTFLKIAFAVNNKAVPPSKLNKLFSSKSFESIFGEKSDFKKYFFGCLCYNILMVKKDMKEIGHAVEFGKFALISVCAQEYKKGLTEEELIEKAFIVVQNALKKWKKFEEYASFQFHNKEFFDYEFTYRTGSFKLTPIHPAYYKSPNLCVDLNDYFFNGQPFIEEVKNFRKGLHKKLIKELNKRGINIDLIKSIHKMIPNGRECNQRDRQLIADKLNLKKRVVDKTLSFIFSRDTGFYAQRIYQECEILNY